MFRFPTTTKEMAENSQVDLRTIQRTMKLFETTSDDLTTSIKKTWIVYGYLSKENYLELVNHINKLKTAKICKRFTKMNEATQKFVERAYEVHGDKYNYNLVEYENLETKVTIICKRHGDFEQSPRSHLRGAEGCKYCEANRKRKLYRTSEINPNFSKPK